MTARVRLLVPIVLVASSAAALTQGRAGAARTGAIVGRVIDASHQPVADVLVMPLWETSSRHGKTIHPFDVRGGSTTNANGEFRIEHLFAGSYYLAALPRNVPRGQPLPTNSDAHRFGYAITYYPSVPRIGDAKPIDVGDKPVTTREATARGSIRMSREALAQIRAGAVKKGDPLQAARLAGIMNMGGAAVANFVSILEPLRA